MTRSAYAVQMPLFLIVYDRPRGRTIDFVQFDEAERDLAVAARNEREQRELDNPQVEVVILEAESEDDLRRTHGRYFHFAREIARREL